MTSADIIALIASTAQQYGVDPQVAIEVATAESNLNQSAVSPAGAIGIFQLMPATAASLGVDPTDPAQNIQGGVEYLAQLISEFNDITAALAAYDWGPTAVAGAIAAYGSAWLSHAPAETQNYVAEILSNISTQYTVSVGTAPATAMASPTGAPAAPGGMDTTTLYIILGIALFVSLALRAQEA